VAYICQRVGEAPTSRAAREDFFDDQTPPSACSIRSGTSRSCLWRGVFQRQTDSVMPIDFFFFLLGKIQKFSSIYFLYTIWFLFFYCYFFLSFVDFFFNSIPYYLILFNFYIEFDLNSLNCYLFLFLSFSLLNFIFNFIP
jgi:hypothetical protein